MPKGMPKGGWKNRTDVKASTEEKEYSGPLIKDVLLEPYFIKVGTRSFDVLENGSIMPEAYCNSLPRALEVILKLQMANSPTKLFTLKQFIEQHEKSIAILKSLLSDLEPVVAQLKADRDKAKVKEEEKETEPTEE